MFVSGVQTVLFLLIFTTIVCPSQESDTRPRVRRQIPGLDLGGFDLGMITSLLGNSGGGILEGALIMLTDSGVQQVKKTVSATLDEVGLDLADMIRNMDPADLSGGLNLFTSPLDPSAAPPDPGNNPLLNLIGGGGSNPFANLFGGNLPLPGTGGLAGAGAKNVGSVVTRSKRSVANELLPDMTALSNLAGGLRLLNNVDGPPSLVHDSLTEHKLDVISAKTDKLGRIADLLEQLANQLNAVKNST